VFYILILALLFLYRKIKRKWRFKIPQSVVKFIYKNNNKMEMKYYTVCFYRYVKLLVLRILSAGWDSDLLFIIYYAAVYG
jgi:hypothetical protein